MIGIISNFVSHPQFRFSSNKIKAINKVMTRAGFFTTFFLLLLGGLSLILATPANIYSQCDDGGGIVNYTSCVPTNNYNCDEQIEIQDLRADQIEEYREHCENTYTNACTEIVQLPGISGYFLFCYNRKDQPTPTPPPPECGYLGQSCCLDMEGKNYCLPGQGGPKAAGGTGCVCTVEEPTVAATPYPTPTAKGSESKTNCSTEGGGDGIQTALGCIPKEPSELIKKFFPFLLGLGGIVAFSLIVFSGIQILTSGGNPEKIQGAKETITSAVTGLLFIVLSLFLLRLIGINFLGLPGLE
jgi:hypothetical protein